MELCRLTLCYQSLLSSPGMHCTGFPCSQENGKSWEKALNFCMDQTVLEHLEFGLDKDPTVFVQYVQY